MDSHKNKEVAYTQHFHIFDQPVLEKSVSSAEFIPYYPVGSLTDCSIIEFNIPSNSVHSLDLSSSYIYIRGRIRKKNKANLTATDIVAPVNNFAGALFSQVEIFVNDNLVCDPNYYPFKSLIDSFLHHNARDRESLLTAGMFIPDDNEAIDTTTNTGCKKRVALAKLSTTWEMTTKIQDGLFRLEKYLPNFVNIRLKLRRSSPAFALVTSMSTAADDDYIIDLDEMIFYCKKITPYDDIQEMYTKELQQDHFPRFYFDRAEIKKFSINK